MIPLTTQVSRCGMVYMEPDLLGWRPLVRSWLPSLALSDEWREKLNSMFLFLVDPCLRFITPLHHYTPVIASNLVCTLMTILSTLLPLVDVAKVHGKAAKGSSKTAPPLEEDHSGIKRMEGSFLFALMWSVGGSLALKHRASFSGFVRKVCKEINFYKMTVQLPASGQLYDYKYDPQDGWINWSHELKTADPIPANIKFTEIVVPTVDTVCSEYLLDLYLYSHKPVLLVGPTGTGKSLYVRDAIKGLSEKIFSNLTLQFSANTSAYQVQHLVDEQLDRVRRGAFAPTRGKQLILFIDDMNMPKLEQYGAQPPIELLRQLIDQGGWYDCKEISFRNVLNTQLVSAMGPADGGRNPITDRFLRHFAVIAMSPFNDGTLTRIFSSMIKWHFQGQGFDDSVSMCADRLVAATKDIFNHCTETMLPTPAKFHYTFNLRDLTKVIQGLCMAQPADYSESKVLVRLWVHEIQRVFSDRLVDEPDQLLFLGWVQDVLKQRVSTSLEEACGHLDLNNDGKVNTVEELDGLFFGDYASKSGARPYRELKDIDALTSLWNGYLKDFQEDTSSPAKLVMFRYAIQHASRIARVLKQPGGNALLVGVGGSGKRSLTRLAAHVMDMELMSVQPTKSYSFDRWRDDLRALLLKVGGEGIPTVFLFGDEGMRVEEFVEDVNSLLNSGEVPHLWGPDDIPNLLTVIRLAAKKARRAEDGSLNKLMSFFTETVKKNLHIVIAMSPVGSLFRDRMRLFPSIVSCSTIDWFHAWPAEALNAVATVYLGGTEEEKKTRESDDPDNQWGEGVMEACVSSCVTFHKTAEDAADLFFRRTGRFCYITPTSYLSLIKTFTLLRNKKRRELHDKVEKYRVGLEKIVSTEKAVGVMQVKHPKISIITHNNLNNHNNPSCPNNHI